MSKPSGHSRSKSASDVRRTLFRTLSRAGGASSSATNLNLASPPRESAEDHEARVVASEGIVVRNEDGTMDLEVPLSASQHAQLLESVEQESDVHMRRETAELVKRHQVDLKQRLPELLRMQVLSLAQDNWMFESDEEN